MRAANRFFILLGAVVALAGCTASANLAVRRGAIDAYVDMPQRVEAKLHEDQAYYGQVLAATSEPQGSPYPTLAADLKLMQRHLDAMKGTSRGIQDYEQGFDAFAQAHPSVSADQSADWQQYQALEARFSPLGQSMQVSLQGYNDAAADFDRTLQANGIAKVKASDLLKEIGDLREELGGSAVRMKDKLHDSHRALQLDAERHLDAETLRRKFELLDKMDKAYDNADALRVKAADAADQQVNAMPRAAAYWTGPGMEDDGSGLLALHQAEDQFRAARKAFFELGERYDKVQAPEIKASDGKDGGMKPGGDKH